jgi:hypothetical protein
MTWMHPSSAWFSTPYDQARSGALSVLKVGALADAGCVEVVFFCQRRRGWGQRGGAHPILCLGGCGSAAPAALCGSAAHKLPCLNWD